MSSPRTPAREIDDRIVPLHLADLYQQASERYGDSPAFSHRDKSGNWNATSFRELFEIGRNLATALIELGVSSRTHVGLIADNRLEWILCDCAIQLCGAADVPRGTDITDNEITHILGHADATVVFVENLKVLEKVQRCRKDLRKIEEIIVMDPSAEEVPRGIRRMSDLIEHGASLRKKGDRNVEERIADIEPEDLFTIIYTSGTTGLPKGVMLSHANMVSQIRNLPFTLSTSDRALSILPVWHSYERVFEMVAVSSGLHTYYTSLRTIAEDLRKTKPTIMASAPRLWESLYQKILANVHGASPLRKKLFNIAYKHARSVRRAEFFFKGQTLDIERRSASTNFRLGIGHALRWVRSILLFKLLDPVVLKKLRAIVGGEFRGTISGGGALQPHVDEFFNFIGIPVLEGYGMTETAPVLAARTWDNLVIGTVGPFFPETQIRIVDLESGETLFPNPKKPAEGRGLRGVIHAKGPQVMSGYYKDTENTEKVLKDGWMNTGDIGMVTFNDCLKILGRSKETIVLLSGENIEPVPIEGRLVESPLIEQCMVVGQDQKYLSALIVPSVEGFRAEGIDAKDAEELAGNRKTKELLDKEVRRLVSGSNGFKSFERISDWRLLPKSFEVGRELTNTFKLKRHVIYDEHQDLIDDIYR